MSKAIVKKQAPGALATWEQEAAAEAKADAAKFQQGLARIVHKNGQILIDGNKVKDNRLVVVMIEAVFSKAYYAGAYDPATPATPTCYAFDPNDTSNMAPHPAAPDKQSERCTGCPHNAFGTADVGRGKRCKDEVRILCAMPTGDSFEQAELRILSVPPSSLKNWGAYVSRLRDMGTSFRAVMTEVSIEEAKVAYKVAFNPMGRLTEPQYVSIKSLGETARERLMQAYPVLEIEEPQPRRKRTKVE